MGQFIHVVCLDCPSPPDYGGAIDMFYKIKALHEVGHRVILHYFDYKQRSTKEVAPFCAAIYAYKRKNIFHSLPLFRPFVVQSRKSRELVSRLNKDEYPIILEGLHCSGIVPYLQNKKRVMLRMHNNEAAYYRQLAGTETDLLKRSYLLQESRLLHRYQKSFDKTIPLACLSQTDLKNLQTEYGFQHLNFIPCFLPWQQVKSKEGRGDYCLYHGNLSISENERAAHWLIKEVFGQLPVPFVIAGKGISKKLNQLAKQYPHITLVNNPPEDEMQAIVSDAHIHVLPSHNSTGVKLKLLNALLNGRFCITNQNGAMGSGITQGLQVQNTAEEWRTSVSALMPTPFSATKIEERKEILQLYNNRNNAQKLSALCWHCQ